MAHPIFGVPGKLMNGTFETLVISGNLVKQVITWFASIHRIGVLGYAERRYADCYQQLDGGDKRVMRAFVDPESISNTFSLLGGDATRGANSEYGVTLRDIAMLLEDAFGTEASFDNSFVERDPGADRGPQRWIFLNGIITSRELAERNVDQLRSMFKRPFTLIHNPTQGLTRDLIEAALQKFTNINTEPVARAFLEIANALLDDTVEQVVVLSHSQGTIIMSDVLDLLYGSIDRTLFDRTNMTDEDFDAFMTQSTGTVKSAELRQTRDRLHAKGPNLIDKLEIFLFANASSRMCYIDPNRKVPHIECYANEHDIVTRLGCLARDDFHTEDLIRIDGSMFTLDRYGHLLNAHYLPDFIAGNYRLLNHTAERCIGSSVHDPVQGNPCHKHPLHVSGPATSKLRDYYLQAQQQPKPAERPRPGAPRTLS